MTKQDFSTIKLEQYPKIKSQGQVAYIFIIWILRKNFY